MSERILGEFLTKQELARELDVHENTIDRWRALPDGLPYVAATRGGKIMFRLESVVEWLRARETSRKRWTPP